MAGFASHLATIGVNTGNAPIVFVSAVPTSINVGGFVNQFTPSGKNGDVEIFDPFAMDAKSVVVTVSIWSESIGNSDVGFSAIDINAFYFERILVDASHTVGNC